MARSANPHVAAAEAILQKCRVKNGGDDYTHASMGLRPGRGKFYISVAQIDGFMAEYGAALNDGCFGEFALVEQHRHIGPVVIDLDFRQPGPERVYTDSDVAEFAKRLLAELRRLVEVPPGSLRCFVLEKPSPRANKGGGFKDGLHLVVPDVVSRPELQVALRRLMLPHVADVFRGFTNAPTDIYDESVISRNGWMMYGSKKPDEPAPWLTTRVYTEDVGASAVNMRPDEQAALFSIRLHYDESPLTRVGNNALTGVLADEAMEANEREAAEARAAEWYGVASGSELAPGQLADTVRKLSVDRAKDRVTWYKVGLVLNNETSGSAEGLELWKTFARKCPAKFDAKEHARLWAVMGKPRSGWVLRFGSLIRWAKEDTEAEAQNARQEGIELSTTSSALTMDVPSEVAMALERIVHALGPREKACWLRVGILLKAAGHGTSRLMQLWVQHVRKSPEFSNDEELLEIWDSLSPQDSEKRVNVGTLVMYAKEDGVALSKADVDAVHTYMSCALGRSAVESADAFRDMLDGLGLEAGSLRLLAAEEVACIKPLLDRIASAVGLHEGFETLDVATSSKAPPRMYVHVRDKAVVNTHLISFETDNFRVSMDSEDHGYLHKTSGLEVPREVSCCLSGCAMTANVGYGGSSAIDACQWMLTRPDNSAAIFKTCASTTHSTALPASHALELQLANPDDATLCNARFVAMGRAPVVVRGLKHIKVAVDAVSKTLEHARHSHNISLVFQVAETIHNHGPLFAARAEDGRLVEGVLVAKWLDLMGSCCDDEREKHNIVFDSKRKEYMYFDLDLHHWVRMDDPDIVVGRVMAAMKTVEGGRFYHEVLSDADRVNIETVRCQRNIMTISKKWLYKGADKVMEKLDKRHDLLPMRNLVIELATGDAREGRWDDYVTMTTGYDFVPEAELPPGQIDWVERFYETVFPVPEERELFLRIAAYALTGSMSQKAFLVLTDKRGGNNGKSCVVRMLLKTFGALGMPTQGNFLYASTASESANSHAANDLSYIGKRIAVFDETDSSRKLDISKVKRLTGGQADMAFRGANAAAVSDVKWTAFIMIACNEGCLPKINATDEALLKRMIVVNMRSLFVPEREYDLRVGEGDVFVADTEMGQLIDTHRNANLIVLLKAYKRYAEAGNSFGPLPEGCLNMMKEVAFNSDPQVEAASLFVDENISFGPFTKPTFIRREELIRLFRATFDRSLFYQVTQATLKKLFDTVMKARGCPLIEDTFISSLGARIKLAYHGCLLGGEYEMDTPERL